MASAAGAKVRGISPQQYHQAEHRGMSPSANVRQRILVWSCTQVGASGSRYIAVSLHTDATFYGRLSFSVANTGYMQVGCLLFGTQPLCLCGDFTFKFMCILKYAAHIANAYAAVASVVDKQ